MEPRSLDGMAAFIRRVAEQKAQERASAGGSSPVQVESHRGSTPAEQLQPHRANENDASPDWQQAVEALETGAINEATVVGWNRGGLLVQWRSLQGFLPASQLQQMIRYTTEAERDAAFAGRVGEALQLKVIEVDRQRKRLVFSERAAQWSCQGGQTTWEQVSSGQVRRGRVRNLCDFGAFVDLGGIDGLIHISELSWRHIKHPADALQIGQEIEVYVMSVEPERKRVALSIKKLRPDPWQDIGARYAIGQTVQATITNVLSFGAFAHIEDGVEGLIHVSELGEGGSLHPRNIVAEGDSVTVTILGIDSAGRRLALSLRRHAT